MIYFYIFPFIFLVSKEAKRQQVILPTPREKKRTKAFYDSNVHFFRELKPKIIVQAWGYVPKRSIKSGTIIEAGKLYCRIQLDNGWIHFENIR